MIRTPSIHPNSPSINPNEISGLEKFIRYNMLTIFEEGINVLLEIPEVVLIIKNWGLISRIYIHNMSNMALRNDISEYVVKKLPIR